MIHKLLAGKGKMKRGLSLLLCLALLGSSVISLNVTAEAESDVTVDAIDTAEDKADDTATETAGGVSTQEADSGSLSEDTNTDSEDASDDGTLVISLSDDADTNKESSGTDATSGTDSNDGIVLTAEGNERPDWNERGNDDPDTIYVWWDTVTVTTSTSTDWWGSTSTTETLNALNSETGISSVELNKSGDTNSVPHGDGGSDSYQSNTGGLKIEKPYEQSGETVTITVTPSAGYYITFICVNCCGSGAAEECETYEEGGAFESNFDISSAGAVTVTVTLDATNGFHHGSNATNYFILIRVAPIPSPLYVEYDYGDIVTYINKDTEKEESSAFSTASGWTEASAGNDYGTTTSPDTSYTQYKYTYNSELETDAEKAAAAAAWKHYANTITSEAREQAAAAGYVFAGWKAVYYSTANSESQVADTDGYQDAYNNYDYTFDDEYGTATYSEGDSVTLTTNVRLIAQWIPIGVKVTKTVSGITDTEVAGDHTYKLQLYRSTDEGSTWTEYGKAIELTVNSDGTASTYIYPLPAGTYKVEETDGNGNLTGTTKTYYITVNYGESVAVTCNSKYSVDSTISETTNVALLTSGLSVTNSYSETPITTEVSVEKVWNDNEDLGKVRPSSVTVTLYAGGEATDKSLTLNDKNDWKGTFTDLDMYSGQTKIEYTVQESDVEYYTAKITGDAETGYIITNTVDSMSVTIEKYITGNMGDTSKAFAFTLTDEDENNITDGFSLKDCTDYPSDGSQTVTGLAIGSTIYLTEESGVYTPTVIYNGKEISADEGTGKYVITLVAGADTITVTNEYNIDPDTGIDLDSAPYILMLAGVAILGGVVLFRKRKKLL